MSMIKDAEAISWNLLTGKGKLISAVRYDVSKCGHMQKTFMSHGIWNSMEMNHSSDENLNCGMVMDFEEKEIRTYGEKAEEIETYAISDPF